MCDRQLFAQCETTQNSERGKGASLFGYTKLYGQVPGGQAEYLRVPQAQFGPVKVSGDHSDDRYLFLSDVLPTAWQAVEYADIPDDGTLAVFGLGPDRADGLPNRPPPWAPCDRDRPGHKAPRDGSALRSRDG
jgi:threonine dehydrogenase-like Zn-dependent dehydrogenase